MYSTFDVLYILSKLKNRVNHEVLKGLMTDIIKNDDIFYSSIDNIDNYINNFLGID
jgi:hypothetical protein